MQERHVTTIHGDDGQPELFQARCSCGWESPYMLPTSARGRAKKHRAEQPK